MVGVLTPWKWTNGTNQGFFPTGKPVVGNLHAHFCLHDCHKTSQGSWSWQNLKIHTNVKMTIYSLFRLGSTLFSFLSFHQGLSLTQSKSRLRTALVFGCLARFCLPGKAIWAGMVMETGSEISGTITWEKKTPQTIIWKRTNRTLLWLKLQFYLYSSQKTFSGSLQPTKTPKLPDINHILATAYCSKLIFHQSHHPLLIPTFILHGSLCRASVPASRIFHSPGKPSFTSLFHYRLSPRLLFLPSSLSHGSELLGQHENPLLCVSL